MTWVVDVGLVLILFLSFVSGVRTGFVDALFSLAGWLGGILAGIHLAGPLRDRLPHSLQSIPGSRIVAGVLLFLVAFAAIRWIGMLAGAGRGSRVSPIDRFLGALFGVLQGFVLVAILASFLVAFVPSRSRFVRDSRALPLVAPAGRVVADLAPEWLQVKMHRGWNALREESLRHEQERVVWRMGGRSAGDQAAGTGGVAAREA